MATDELVVGSLSSRETTVRRLYVITVWLLGRLEALPCRDAAVAGELRDQQQSVAVAGRIALSLVTGIVAAYVTVDG